MSTQNRPLSPHLSIYSPQFTTATSIAHRITGVLLSFGAVFLAAWLVALSSGADAYASFSGIVGAWYGQIIAFAFTAALYYHMCNGIRHLFWDSGYGFEIETAYASAKAAVAASLVLTLITWGIAIASGSGP
jgi:succinate dehydrogenase / fumarate reductase cytochrome b subunit